MTTTTTTRSKPEERYLVEFERLGPELAHREPQRLARLRREGIETFSSLGFPTTKQEEWRFTNVSPIARTAYRPASDATAGDRVERDALSRYLYEGCHRLVLVNGRLAPELSDLAGLPDGVVVTGLADALQSHADKVEPHLGRHARFQEHPFVALNTALWQDGAFVWLPPNTVLDKPINLLVVSQAGAEPSASFPRHLFVAGENSQGRLVEQYVTVGDGRTFVCPVSEVVSGPASVLDHYKLQRESTAAHHMATLQIWQDRASNFSSHSLSWGGALVRNDVNAVLDGEGCEATLNGLYLVEGDQLVDNHMRVEHAKPHCDSHELYKGILEGRSKAVFNGRIYVHKGAQKTDAKQTNRNLLLSPDALCNSNPQLEIFADDVKCTHGSTVGQLDQGAVFYLRSRGIGEEAARSLLTYAFAADIVERIRIEPVRLDLEEFLFRRLPKGDIVRQAV